MTLGDLGVLYAVAGVMSGVVVARKSRQGGRRALLSVALAVVLWPLWLPVALAPAPSRLALDPSLRTSTEVALLEAHGSVRDGPLEGLLPRSAVERIIDEVRRAAGRHRELEGLLARSDFDLPAAGTSVMLFGGQWAIDAGRGDLEDIRRCVDAVQQIGRRPGQRGDRVEIQGLVAIGDHGDARRTGCAVDDHVFDFITCTREFAVE